MFLGSNLQYLRKITGAMTQERLAEQMGVSRQTVSKWESGEAYPELPKLMDLCEIFHCKLDDLLRQDMPSHASTYYPVRIIRVAGFRRAQYVMISPNPEDDVNAYMDAWAKKQGLLDVPGAAVKKIGWDFPYVSGEQKNRFGLRGYVCAYVLPEDLDVAEDGVQLIRQGAEQNILLPAAYGKRLKLIGETLNLAFPSVTLSVKAGADTELRLEDNRNWDKNNFHFQCYSAKFPWSNKPQKIAAGTRIVWSFSMSEFQPKAEED
jgi:transcriptional regulator with XRE-family HTH domain